MSKFVFAVVSLVLFSSSPTFASDGFWSQLKDLGHRCAVQPYAISAEGFKVYGSLRSVCAELELTAKQAAFVLEGSHYVATLEDSEHAESMEQLLGIEGNAARVYFQHFAGMMKSDDERKAATTDGTADFAFDFVHRNRRPPRDPVNALLSLAYSVLAKDLTIVCHAVGFDPFLGFYHQPRFGRAALALDLMEPFRPLIADSIVLSAVNTRMVGIGDFVRTGNAVALKPEGRKKFFTAYEQRMDSLVTHPLFGYRLSYRRLLEVQTRLLARMLSGEIRDYPVFTTR